MDGFPIIAVILWLLSLGNDMKSAKAQTGVQALLVQQAKLLR
jgi:hypothetical protein